MISDQLTELHAVLDLATINTSLRDIVSSDEFVSFVHDVITEPRVLSRLDDFKIIIVHNTEHTDGGVGEVILQRSKFNKLINTKEDLLEQLIHDAMHEVQWDMWKKCNTKVSDLSSMEHDVFDEILMQAHIFKTMPELHHLHAEYVINSIKIMGYVPGDVASIIEVFREPTDDNYTRNALSIAHRWLYAQEDVLNQETFNQFMAMCFQSLKDPTVGNNINNYELALNGQL